MASPRLLTLLLLAALALCIGSGAATAQGAKPPAADPLARFRASLVPPPAPSEISLRQRSMFPPIRASSAPAARRGSISR